VLGNHPAYQATHPNFWTGDDFATNLLTQAHAVIYLALARKQKLPMRLAALSLGIKRVQEAKRIRGLFP